MCSSRDLIPYTQFLISLLHCTEFVPTQKKIVRMGVTVREDLEIGFDFREIEEKLGIGFVDMDHVS